MCQLFNGLFVFYRGPHACLQYITFGVYSWYQTCHIFVSHTKIIKRECEFVCKIKNRKFVLDIAKSTLYLKPE